MAILTNKATLGIANSAGEYEATGSSTATPDIAGVAVLATAADAAADVAVAAKPDSAAVAAAVAVLVADGASPTQAHVNTLNAAWGTLDTAITAVNTDIDDVKTATAATAAAANGADAADAADMLLIYDTSVVSTGNKFKACVIALLQMARSRGLLLP